MTVRLPLNHDIATITTSATGVSHGLQGGTQIEMLPVDREGRVVAPSVCGKVIRGDVRSVDDEVKIRCRPCKRAIAKGRPVVPIRRG